MAYQIDEFKCIGCEVCISVCPFEAIHKRSTHCIIYEQECYTDCGNCKSVCPCDAIYIDEDGPYSGLALW